MNLALRGEFSRTRPAAVRAGAVITVAGPTFAPGFVVFEGGVIRDVGGGAPPAGVDLVDAGPRSILLPGLVSAHTHLALGDFKGCADDLPFLEWLLQGLLPAIQATPPSSDRFARGAEASSRELLTGGVTLVGDNFFRADGLRAGARTGQRVAFFQEVFGSLAPDEDAFWRTTEAMLDEVDAQEGVAGYSPHTPWTCPPATFRRVAERARLRGRRLSFHLDESREEHEFLLTGGGPLAALYDERGTRGRYPRGMTPTALVNEAAALGKTTVVAHAVQVTAADIALLAATGTGVAHCPRSNMKLAEGVAPVAAMIEAGITVALGVDSAASNTRLDMFAEMRAALELQRAATGRVGPMTAATVLRMATLNGAAVLGMEARTGSLDVGKLADFIVVDAGRDDRHGRWSDPTSTIVHACGPEDVALVVVGGEVRHRRDH